MTNNSNSVLDKSEYIHQIKVLTQPVKLNFNKYLLHSCDLKTVAELIVESVLKNNPSVFFHAHLYNYYLLQKHIKISKSILPNYIFWFEGIAMKLGAFLLGLGWNKDINGTDLYPLVFEKLSNSGKSVFFLGSKEAIITKAIEKITNSFPDLIISDYHNGFFPEKDDDRIVSLINSSNPDILIIGMGTINEINFLNRNYSKLKVKTIWHVGGLFAFISDDIPRAPLFMRKIRLEWLFRFFMEPIKKFPRISKLPFWFLLHLIKLAFGYQNNVKYEKSIEL